MSSLGVNNLLHTLRGEQFRHSQNVRGSRSHLLVSSPHNSPTLPLGLIYSAQEPANDDIQVVDGPAAAANVIQAVNGDLDSMASPAWRAQALSIIYRHLPTDSSGQGSHTGNHTNDSPHVQSSAIRCPVPTLTHLCLLVLASEFSSQEFSEEIVPFFPPHLRRELLRYTSVHSPLPNSKLYPLYEPSGHADGEFVVIGPYSSLRGDHFQRTHHMHSQSHHDSPQFETVKTEIPLEEGELEELSWDSPVVRDQEACTECHTVAILSCGLSTSSLLTLPPTVTHLALINISSPVPLHRLPGVCPLIVVLDLSYNTWVDRGSQLGTILNRVMWTRWNELRVLGLRGCSISEVTITKINEGRWNDVEIVW